MIKIIKHIEEKPQNEHLETSIGESTSWVTKLSSSIPAFQSRNYKLYFGGQLISLTGTWLQVVAQGWLILQLTNSAYYLGLVSALSSLPSLFLTVFGGVVVDRYSKKKILIFTQFSSMILAFTLGTLTLMEIVTVWEICVIAFLLGVVNAVDAPARHAFVPEMVNKEQLASAIALNSGIFNAARVIGPGLAGLLIVLTGTGGAFIINGVSYIAVILALFAMNIKAIISDKRLEPIKAIKQGFAYSFSHPVIGTLMILTGITSIFGWSYTALMPIVTKNVFHLGAAGLGYFYASVGSGAVLATIIIALFSKKIRPMTFIISGNILFSISLLLFSYTHSVHIALILLFTAGFGLISQFAMINTTIQRMVKSELRGRVMSIYVLMFIGLFPIGSYEVGYVAEYLGTDVAIRIGAIIVLIAGLVLLFIRKRISHSYQEYKIRNK